MDPFFSIILPTYNRSHFLPKAIESVLAQSFSNWELIIVDDGSTDNTKEIVEAYPDPRIKYHYQCNQERSAARNNGISLAKGSYICFLDSDDYYLENKLQHFYEAIDKAEYRDVIFYDGLIFEFRHERTEAAIPIKPTKETLHEFLISNPLGALQLCIPIKALEKNQFNKDLRIGEDVELWLRLANSYDFLPISSYNTIAVDHNERSVNLQMYNSGFEQLKQLDIICKTHEPNKISGKIRKRTKSNCQLNIAKFYMYKGKKFQAFKWLIKSIFTDRQNPQTRHKAYCLLQLVKGRIPLEYQSS